MMGNRVYKGENRIVYAVGDLHGDHGSFRKALALKEREEGSLLLFLGDYADRGPEGVEIITELYRLLDEREDIVALKGNHEDYRDGRPVFSPCDLPSEAEAKYGSWERFYEEVMKGFLGRLHIAAVIGSVLFVHAGISSAIETVDDLAKEENEKDILWSDPSAARGEHFNIRGAGITFGEDVTVKVLDSLGLRMLVRSHEPRKAAYGPHLEHGGMVITTNACTSYGEPWEPFVLKVDTMDAKYEPVFLA
jgi:serine/threonine-protein phosphatase PP1 catalytic subunit